MNRGVRKLIVLSDDDESTPQKQATVYINLTSSDDEGQPAPKKLATSKLSGSSTSRLSGRAKAKSPLVTSSQAQSKSKASPVASSHTGPRSKTNSRVQRNSPKTVPNLKADPTSQFPLSSSFSSSLKDRDGGDTSFGIQGTDRTAFSASKATDGDSRVSSFPKEGGLEKALLLPKEDSKATNSGYHSLSDSSDSSDERMSPSPVTTRKEKRASTQSESRKSPTAVVSTPLPMSANDEETSLEQVRGPSKTSSSFVYDKSGQREVCSLESQKSFSPIGTTSPLVTRLKQRTRTPSEIESPHNKPAEDTSARNPLEELEQRLQAFYQDLKDEIALMARCLFHDAKKVSEAAPNSSLHKVSPWDSLKSIEVGQGPTRLKDVTTKIEARLSGKANNNKIKAPTLATIAGKSFKDNVPSVPQYTAITVVKRNFLTADDEVLRYIPYLGDDSHENPSGHKRLVKELEEAYSNSGLSTRESELCGQIRGYLDSWLPQCDLTERLLQRYTLHKKWHTLKKQKKVLDLVLKSLGGPVSDDLAQRAENFTTAFKSVFDLDLTDVVLPESRLKELVRGLRSTSDENEKLPPSQLVFATFANWVCLVCGVAYCQVHGDYINDPVYHIDESLPKETKDNAEYEYSYQPLGLTYTDLLRKHDMHIAHGDVNDDFKRATDLPACSQACYLISDDEVLNDAWPQEKLKSLKEFAVVFTDKDTRACNISLALDLPCWQVHCEIQKYEKYNNEAASIQQPRKIHDRPQWYNNEKKSLHTRWEEWTEVHQHEERSQLNTCAHEGPCTNNNCDCARNNTLCERWCMCSDDCGRRFTGCNCAAVGACCEESSCICIQMNRECGPECITCGAIDRIDPANKHRDALFTTGCQNIVLQRRKPKRLVVGESTLEGVGFGAYMAESAKKGDYLGEYVGEVITFKESERRGILYERKHSSFLFDLNSEWTIDAARHGNKTRFINHAPNEARGLNCTAKVMLSNGEHRIKFIALRDITPGEELLFNYGKKFESHLSKKQTLMEKKTATVLTGKEALDALDGLSPETRATRKKISAAIRGGRGGGAAGRGKARKTAAPKTIGKDSSAMVVDPKVDLEESNSEDEGGEEEEESDEGNEENAERRRPRRNIKKPKRYTR